MCAAQPGCWIDFDKTVERFPSLNSCNGLCTTQTMELMDQVILRSALKATSQHHHRLGGFRRPAYDQLLDWLGAWPSSSQENDCLWWTWDPVKARSRLSSSPCCVARHRPGRFSDCVLVECNPGMELRQKRRIACLRFPVAGRHLKT